MLLKLREERRAWRKFVAKKIAAESAQLKTKDAYRMLAHLECVAGAYARAGLTEKYVVSYLTTLKQKPFEKTFFAEKKNTKKKGFKDMATQTKKKDLKDMATQTYDSYFDAIGRQYLRMCLNEAMLHPRDRAAG